MRSEKTPLTPVDRFQAALWGRETNTVYYIKAAKSTY